MNTSRLVAATLAALALSTAFLPTPTLAQARQGGISTLGKISAANPLQYVQRGTSAKGDFMRTLSLFKNGRAMLVSIETDSEPATVQTGTWKPGSRADRFSISLTRQNEKPYQETILMVGTPGSGEVVSAIGASTTQYGAYGLTFAPRIPNNVTVSGTDKPTITATGIQAVPLDGVKRIQITADGFDAIYWKHGGGGGVETEGQSLYYLNTLTGKSRRIAGFPALITQVSETRLSSGRPVLIVSCQSVKTGVTGVAVVDPLRERTMKQWRATRLTEVKPGAVTIASYRAGGTAQPNAKPVETQTVPLDRFF
ncbi:MAG: hypothetical protein H8F28_01265 [Fibrella sp.]|nr:hypothetical protein [Armatimonadota bacterium]